MTSSRKPSDRRKIRHLQDELTVMPTVDVAIERIEGKTPLPRYRVSFLLDGGRQVDLYATDLSFIKPSKAPDPKAGETATRKHGPCGGKQYTVVRVGEGTVTIKASDGNKHGFKHKMPIERFHRYYEVELPF